MMPLQQLIGGLGPTPGQAVQIEDPISRFLKQDKGDPLGQLIEQMTKPKKDPQTGEKFFNDTATQGEITRQRIEGKKTFPDFKNLEKGMENKLKTNPHYPNEGVQSSQPQLIQLLQGLGL